MLLKARHPKIDKASVMKNIGEHKAVRVPKQARSIAKKQKIVATSYRLFSSKGYYRTNTAEIAKEAGISTGIVYSYYQDKKQILLDVVKYYISSLEKRFEPLLVSPVTPRSLPSLVRRFLKISAESQTENREAHNEFVALSLLEEDIHALFDDFEDSVIAKLCDSLKRGAFPQENLLEKVRLCYGIIEQASHFSVQRKIAKSELPVMDSLAEEAVVGILGK